MTNEETPKPVDPARMKALLDKWKGVLDHPIPETLRDKLINVQPLKGPTGLIFYYKMRYGSRPPTTCPDKL